MAIKRLISEDQKKQINDTALLRQKKHVNLDAGDIKKLVIALAIKAGLLRTEV